MNRHRLTPVLVLAGALLAPAAACAQNSSLYGNPQTRQPLMLADVSWTYQKPIEPQPIKPHDLVTVIINEQSVVISEGEMDRKKKAHGDLILKDWIFLKGLNVFPNPQVSGDPHIRGEIDNKLRAEAQLETRDSMKFRMACEVVDIRPNGVLVIEGRRTIQNNEEVWEYALTGDIRPEDILPNNTVQSENVANLRLNKRELGHVRDGYRRGWMLLWLDHVQPF
ncbi:MAG: flagellar basal body L-ring protein FlgH [Planctomycetota bacterium]